MNALTVPNGNTPVKILVVDDHPNTAMTLARALARLGSKVEVVSATGGNEALEHTKQGVADILITDMMMPDMTGLELIEKLQKHQAGSPSFYYLMTAYDVPGINEIARDLKINEIFIKPVHPELISRIVNKAIDLMKFGSTRIMRGSNNE